MTKIRSFIKKEAVFCISALCAAVTMLLVPPSKEYAGYIDFHVLILLLCLMAVVAGFKSIGAFRLLTYQLLRHTNSGRTLGITLVLLPFFASMLVTNDVSLLVFIPFTMLLLTNLRCEKNIIPVIVLQTVAANLGSMATPVGNPQNLFLYSAYNLGAGEFFRVTLPLTIVSLAALILFSAPALPRTLPKQELKEEKITDSRYLVLFAVLFLFCLLTVFRVMSHYILLAVIVTGFLLLNRSMKIAMLKDIDFMLLLTFVCFFVVSGNLGRVDAVRDFLQTLLTKSTLLTSVATSQIISNVPAAVLLSSFTDNWQELLAGVNIGGLGTPIASLASLITLKLYMNTKGARAMKFVAVFTLANAVGLAVLLGYEFIF